MTISSLTALEDGLLENCGVSVIIPAFNAARTIIRAIESVRVQNYEPVEVIVIDDGSIDGTMDVVSRNMQDAEAIICLRLEKNGGVSAARNAGIALARGKYLAFLDADDVWLPGKLANQVERMRQDATVTIVSCNSRLVSETGKVLKEGHVNRPPAEGDDAWKTLLRYNFMPTPTILTYTHLVKKLNGFDENLTIGEDLDLWIRLATLGKVAVLRECLTLYYDSADSLMKRYQRKTGAIVVPMLDRHLESQSTRLSSFERRKILGYQSFNIACNLYFSGSYSQCIPIFLKAMSFGERPLKSLSYIPRAIFMHMVSGVRQGLNLKAK